MFRWLRTFWEILVGKKTKVTVTLTADEIEILSWQAERNGKSLEDWSKDAILRSISTLERRVFEKAQADQTPMNLAFEALNQMEETDRALPVRAEPEPVRVMAAEKGLHSCMFLSLEFDPKFPPGQSSGTCRSPRQDGRVCFWNTDSAVSCPAFRPFRVQRSA